MKILHITILLSSLWISYVVAQRRQQHAGDVQGEAQQLPAVAARGRGRARFVKTAEFEQVSSDYAAAARSAATEGQGRSEDRASVYHRPRVITEDKFELQNAPRSRLFEPELPVSASAERPQPVPIPVDELIRNFGSLRSDEPTKLELPQILPVVEQEQGSESTSLGSTTSKGDGEGVSSSTTEKDVERELLKKEQSTKRTPESTTVDASSTPADQVRKTIIRSRGRQPESGASTTAPTSSVPQARSRSRSRASTATGSKVDLPEPRRASQLEVASESITSRGSFRVGRRRPTSTLKDRGPTVIEEDSQSPKTRTGRDSHDSSYPTSRRGSVRNTAPRVTTDSALIGSTIRARTDARRSRGRKVDVPTGPALQAAPAPSGNRPTEFANRRARTRTSAPSSTPPPEVVQRASPRIDRTFQEPLRTTPPRTQSVEGAAGFVPPSRDTSSKETHNLRSRTRSRFQLSDLESVKLEPQQSVEHSTRALPRRTGRTRPPTVQAQVEELIASSTVENPIRVTLPPTSTVRSVNAIPMRIKESVHSEVSEVISSRKVTRRKNPAKATSDNRKGQEVEDNIDELNYPPQFKAIILANKSKEEKKPEVESESYSPPLDVGVGASVGISSTSLPSTSDVSPTSTTPGTTTVGPLFTSTLSAFPATHEEDGDNDLAPTPHPTRRRFSVSTTRKPTYDITRKPPHTSSTRKPTVGPDANQLGKLHARFNNHRNRTGGDEVTSTPATITTSKRTTKPSTKPSYARKPDKLAERKFNQSATKAHRYSARYRNEAARSSAPTRAATTSPVYIPTVPTVTPAGAAPAHTTAAHQAPQTNDDELDDIKIISIAQPIANSLYSANLVTENNRTVSASDTPPAGSIIERIISSISSISTSTTSKPEVKASTESAIYKIPAPPKRKGVEESTTARVPKTPTTEKPTTIIERILNSLSAIQASDNNVGNATAGDGAINHNELDSVLEAPTALPPVPQLVSSTPSATTTTSATTIATTTAGKVAPAPTNPPFPSKSTVAISLVDYLASLGVGKAVTSTTTLPSTTATATTTTITTAISTTPEDTTTPTTLSSSTGKVLDENRNTINYLETVSFGRYTEPPTTVAITTIIPTTTPRKPPSTTVNWLVKLLGLETTTVPTTTSKPDTTTTTDSIASTVRPSESTTFTIISTTLDPTTDSTTMMTSTRSSKTDRPTTLEPNVSPKFGGAKSSSEITHNQRNSTTEATNANNRTGRVLQRLPDEIDNEITSSEKNNNDTNASTVESDRPTGGSSTTLSPHDYFVFAVLPNNTIVRKRPRKMSTPYFIYGVYPNNTIVRKYPNGTLVPEDPVVQDLSEIVVDQASIDLSNNTGAEKTLHEHTSFVSPTITTAPSTTTVSDATEPTEVASTTLVPTTEVSAADDWSADFISTEMSIDLTTLNIPVAIELGPTTESDLVENISDQTDQSEDGVSTTTASNLAEIAIESKGRFESDADEELEGTTPAMPDISTIVLQTTSSTATESTISPDAPPTISTDWMIMPTSVRTTSLPATGDDVDQLDNEIRNVGTSRVVEVSATTTGPTIPTTPPRTTVTVTTSEPFSTTEFRTPSTRPTTTTSTSLKPSTARAAKPTTATKTATKTTTTRPTTTSRTTTTSRPTPTTTIRPTTIYIPTATTTDITTFIANLLSTLRPVYTPTTVASVPTMSTTTETTTVPTVTITARRRTTTTTEPTTPVRITSARRRTQPTTTTKPITVTLRSHNVIPTTTFRLDTTMALDPSKVDIDQLIKHSKKKLTPHQLEELEQLKALEREQANLLQQLSMFTNLNFNGQAPKGGAGGTGGNLANRIVQFAKERDRTTTESLIFAESATTRAPRRLPVLDSKGTTVEDIIKELHAAQNAIGDGNSGSGRSQEAILAEILKQRGIEPSTPRALSDAFRPTTTRRPRPTTTQRPGRIVQGLNWLLTQFAGPQEAAVPAPSPRPRPKPTTRRTTTSRPEEDELSFQSTEVNNVVQNMPTTTHAFKRPVNSLSDEELSRLISQLEAIQRDPKQAQNLDITPFRKLQAQSATLNDQKVNVEIFTTGGGSQEVTRKSKAAVNNRVRTAKSTTSNSLEDFDEDNDVTTARTRAAATRARATLPPVELNHVPGIEDPERGPQIGGNFLTAAMNVTRAISTFLGAAIQVAARQVASMVANGSRSLAAFSPTDSATEQLDPFNPRSARVPVLEACCSERLDEILNTLEAD